MKEKCLKEIEQSKSMAEEIVEVLEESSFNPFSKYLGKKQL